MSRECITHHNACDCREAEFAELEKKVEAYEKALEFYADKFNWSIRSGKIGITALTNGEDAEIVDGQWTNGKHARQVLKEWKK